MVFKNKNLFIIIVCSIFNIGLTACNSGGSSNNKAAINNMTAKNSIHAGNNVNKNLGDTPGYICKVASSYDQNPRTIKFYLYNKSTNETVLVGISDKLPDNPTGALAVSGNFVYVAAGNGWVNKYLIKLGESKPIALINHFHFDDNPTGITVSPDGTRVYTITDKNWINVFDNKGPNRFFANYHPTSETIKALTMSPDGKHVYIGYNKKTSVGYIRSYKVLGAGELDQVGNDYKLDDQVVCLKVSADGMHLYSSQRRKGTSNTDEYINWYTLDNNDGHILPSSFGHVNIGWIIPSELEIASDGKELYVLEQSDDGLNNPLYGGNIDTFIINSDGSLTRRGSNYISLDQTLLASGNRTMSVDAHMYKFPNSDELLIFSDTSSDGGPYDVNGAVTTSYGYINNNAPIYDIGPITKEIH